MYVGFALDSCSGLTNVHMASAVLLVPPKPSPHSHMQNICMLSAHTYVRVGFKLQTGCQQLLDESEIQSTLSGGDLRRESLFPHMAHLHDEICG